jgi:hypothetical protein
MKHFIIFFVVIHLCLCGYAQVNHYKAYKLVLHRNNVGKEYSFNQSKEHDYDSLVLIYLGQIKTNQGRVLKLLTSRWYWGLAPRGTSRIIIFNQRNQYLGDYYLTMTYEVPDKIENRSLVFINDANNSCAPHLVTRISFRNGIPKKFFLECKDGMGDLYYFEQNLY